MRHHVILLLALVCVVLPAAATDTMLPPYTFESPVIPPTVSHPIRVTIHGTNFSDTTAVRLANNISGGCRDGVAYADINTIPDNTVSNVVRWSETNNMKLWVVNFRVLKEQLKVLVCYTTNGKNWHAARNSEGANHFSVWRDLPTMSTVPKTVSNGQLVYIKVNIAAPNPRAVLVSSYTSCVGTTPQNVIPGGEEREMTGYRTFSFTPRYTGVAYLCVVSSPHDAWSVVPLDNDETMTFPGGRYRTANAADPYADLGLYLWPEEVRHRKAHLQCSTLIGGAPSTCTIHVTNHTNYPKLVIDPTIVKLTELLDGQAQQECPLPLLRQGVDEHYVEFTWIPQNWGREGTLRMSFNDQPLMIETNALNEEYYKWSEIKNATPSQAFIPTNPRTLMPADRDGYKTHFFVLAPFSHLDNYAYANLVNFHYFQNKENFEYKQGFKEGTFYGRQNGTADNEMWGASLKDGITTSTMDYIAVFPAGATKCRLSSHYYFAARDTDLTSRVLLGTIQWTLVDQGSVDITSKTFTLYSLGRKVIVEGAIRPGYLDGDIYTLEQLMHEITMLENYHSVRIELMITHAGNQKFFWVDPRVKCAVVTPRLDHKDLDTLKKIYGHFTVVAGTPLASWKTAAGLWNGDPCSNNWNGVYCRHNRVIELNLANNQLSGEMVSLQPLEMLEKLSLANNALVGTLHLNNSRLVTVDVSENDFFKLEWNANALACMQVLQASNNRIQFFPTQLTSMPQIKTVDISKNEIVGVLPDFSTLQELEVLNVHSNYLHDSLPRLTTHRMRSLDLSQNRFNGSIPIAFGEFKNMLYLDVSKNQLTGHVPVELAKIRTAANMVLRAEDNFLSGALPRLPVKILDMRNNFFRCPLPYENDYLTNDPEHVVGLNNYLQCDEIDEYGH